jgi:prophage regulatory protein
MGAHIVTSKIVTRAQLKQLVPYSLSHIARLEQIEKFPRRLKLGPNRVGWLATEIDAWIQEKSAGRPQK